MMMNDLFSFQSLWTLYDVLLTQLKPAFLLFHLRVLACEKVVSFRVYFI